jgi:hypothetical protein
MVELNAAVESFCPDGSNNTNLSSFFCSLLSLSLFSLSIHFSLPAPLSVTEMNPEGMV